MEQTIDYNGHSIQAWTEWLIDGFQGCCKVDDGNAHRVVGPPSLTEAAALEHGLQLGRVVVDAIEP
jgi:hypothetical protein